MNAPAGLPDVPAPECLPAISRRRSSALHGSVVDWSDDHA